MAQWSQAVDEVVVGTKLERSRSRLAVEFVGRSVLDKRERVLTKLFSVADGDVQCGHGHGVSDGVRSVWPGQIAVNGVPVLVRARPELDKPIPYSEECNNCLLTAEHSHETPYCSLRALNSDSLGRKIETSSEPLNSSCKH